MASSPRRGLHPEAAQSLHGSLHMDLNVGELTPPAHRVRGRHGARQAGPAQDGGHSVSHGTMHHFPDETERRRAEPVDAMREAEESLHSSAGASRMSKRKELLRRAQPAGASAARIDLEDRVAERDEKPVVDWWTEPDLRVAETVALLSRPVWVPDPADTTQRMPFDRTDAELDGCGFPTGHARAGVKPAEYPLRETTLEDLGRIGGMGLRMYFTVLRGLAILFAVLAFCSIPALIATGTGEMFAVYDLQAYACAGAECTAAECCVSSTGATAAVPSRPETANSSDCSAAARGTCTVSLCAATDEFVATLSTSGFTKLTLGNICAPEVDVDGGSVAPLWWITVFAVITSVGLVALVVLASSHMRSIKQSTDAAMVSMSDYTVKLLPGHDWHDYTKIETGAADVVKGSKGIKELSDDVEGALERAIPGSKVAEIDGKPMVVIAWNEDENIKQWRAKMTALRDLEDAIATAYRTRKQEQIDKALHTLDTINTEENALNRGKDAMRWRPVCIFVTFENDEHYEEALKLETVNIGGHGCTIAPADEPEAIQWANLEYIDQFKRRAKIHTATFFILMIGFVLLIYFNVLKEESASSTDPADKDSAKTWGRVATFAVVAINQVLKRSMMGLTPYEKAHTVDEEQGAVAIRVFVCQLFNTAILMLILRSEFGPVSGIPGDHFAQVNAKWYAAIGAPLVGTMLIQFMTNPIVVGIQCSITALKVKLGVGNKQTQNGLNELLMPADFNIAASYGEALLAATVTLFYGGGIPFLYWIAAAGFTLRFCLDKWAVLRVHRKPPLYGSGLFDSFDETAAFLVVGHIGMFVYFLGTAGGTDPTGTIGFSPFRPHCWPMFIVFVLAAIVAVGKLLGFLTEKELEDADDSPTFSEAYTKGLIVNEDDDYKMDDLEQLQVRDGRPLLAT